VSAASLEELADELVALEPGPTFDPAKLLHAGQLAAFLCTLATVVIVAGRRWGKSVLACVKAYSVALANPGVTCCLIGATQGTISRIWWRTLKELDRSHGLGAVFLKGVEGWSATLPNGSQVVLLPVDSEEAADKVRGLSKVAFVCVDESQRYRKAVLDYLVLDVIKAMFIDLRARGDAAQLWLMGTPNPAGKAGTLWNYWSRPNVGHFGGTVYDNDKLGPRDQIERVVDEMLKEEADATGVPLTRESVWYRREILAEWVVDFSVRVYYFDDDRNVWVVLPTLTHYAIIGDIGVRDADALGLFGWRDGDPTLYLVREVVKRGQDTLDLGAQLEALIKEFDPLLVALDAGGLGLKTLLTLQKLFPGVPIKAVTKPTVNLQVKAYNTRLARGFKAAADSQLYAEVRNPQWVDGIINGKIDENGHSDVVPMARYAALELEQLMPTVEAEKTDEEKHREKRAEMAAKAERNRLLSSGDQTYDPTEFTEDLELDLYDEG
jgi:hypothetical protein